MCYEVAIASLHRLAPSASQQRLCALLRLVEVVLFEIVLINDHELWNVPCKIVVGVARWRRLGPRLFFFFSGEGECSCRPRATDAVILWDSGLAPEPCLTH